MTTIHWLWIVAGLSGLAVFAVGLAKVLDLPVCPTCGGRIHALRCPWRES